MIFVPYSEKSRANYLGAPPILACGVSGNGPLTEASGQGWAALPGSLPYPRATIFILSVLRQTRAQVGDALALASEVVDDVAGEQRAFRRPGDGFLQVGAVRGLVRADAGDERGCELHFGVIAAQRDRLFDQRVAVEIGWLF